MRSTTLLVLGVAVFTAYGGESVPFDPRRVVPEMEPIVDAPVVPAAEAFRFVSSGELVLGVVAGGEARAYPINQLTGPAREIINDTLGGTAIAATW